MTSLPPQEVRLLKASRVVEIVWENGTHSRYAFSMLRKSCLCSECKSMAGRAEQIIPQCGTGAIVTKILPVGNYALQLCFDDGHDRGIYPFAYLQKLETSPAHD